jgi:signal transduction histidine kinase/ligand-binding sensor domain-containing protein/DNA-binding response OmpR family regulator
MRSKFIILWFLIFGSQTYGQGRNFIFEQISPEGGFSYAAISTIVLNDYGFVWFGSHNGLYYYNNSEIIRYKYDPLNDHSIPSDKVLELHKDTDGRIWICTDNGVAYYNETINSFTRLHLKKMNGESLINAKVTSILQYTNTDYLIVLNDLLYSFDINEQVLKKINVEADGIITYLGKIEDGHIYVGTNNGKLFRNSSSNLEFNLFYSSGSGHITTLCFINNNYWIGFQNNGIEVVNDEGTPESIYKEEFSGEHHIVDNQVQKIIQRTNGEIWIATLGGLSVINSEGNWMIKPDRYNGLPHMGIFDLYLDRNDGVWIGTWSGGLAYYSNYNYKFFHITKTWNGDPVKQNVVSSFAEENKGNIWIGSENLGLNLFNLDQMSFVGNEKSIDKWPVSRVKVIKSDRYERQWIGTFNEGLWVKENNQFRRIEGIHGVTSSILPVDSGIWIGDRMSGLLFYNTTKGIIQRFQRDETSTESISSNYIWDLFLDSAGNLWVSSDYGISVKRKDSQIFERFFSGEDTGSLSRNMIYTISEDNQGKLWFGTSGGGIDIYDPELNTFSEFSLNSYIKYSDVYCILRDHLDNMWFSTNKGLYVYYPNSNSLENHTVSDGIKENHFHPNSGFISSCGKLFFGGGNGFTIIDPTTIQRNKVVPDVFLSKLLINGQSYELEEFRFMNSQFLPAIENIQLKHNQNSLTIGFTSNNFVQSEKTRFRYRLKNYQDEWIEVYPGSDISFTKVPPGDYVLEVLASNNDGLWGEKPMTVAIKIHPVFWMTWYAYIFYAMLVAGILLLVFRELRFRIKSRNEKILLSEKVRFFTNVSHEFRTPLTLILSPLNKLSKELINNPDLSDMINGIMRNADRLLRLTNQLLDFRLVELNKINLKIQEEDIIKICRNTFDCFEFQMKEKNIKGIYNASIKKMVLAIDKEKIDCAVYNLFSNALKYSSEGGEIIFSIKQKTISHESYSGVFFTGNKFFGEALEITIKDNGKGIKKDMLPKIFERFYVNHTDVETGTGIGLHICQEYIKMHNGNLMVFSEPGQGSSFIINIPINSKIETRSGNIFYQSNFIYSSQSENHDSFADKSTGKKTLLIVDDHDELRKYFKKDLSSHYKILTAKNGQQAYEIAKEVFPDAIISDIIMPGVSGLELIDMIRKNSKTSQIPIVMLTALSDNEHMVKCMNKGANAFLIKPVDQSYLLAIIENILRERESLKKIYEDIRFQTSLGQRINESFLEKAERIVNNNLQDQSFDISKLASELNISKSSLQRKMKVSINLNPTGFIRDVRLKSSLVLLKQRQLNIDEIAMMVGFNSTSYFIRVFKKKFGKTPTEFRAD